jgi:putative RecB family exonuclease
MSGTAPTPRNQFSFSRLKTFHQCPLRYRYRYLKGMREAFRSIESFLGSTVHSVLEWLYERRSDGELPELETVHQTFAREWESGWSDDVAVIKTATATDDSFRLGREMLIRFHDEVFFKDRSETLALEQRFSVKLSPEVVFTGIADRVGRTEHGRLFVVDYKTSSRRGTAAEFSEGLQAPLYTSCAMRHHDASEALAGYHYLRLGATSWHRVTRGRGEELLRRFLELVDEVRGAAEFPARPSVLCAWCGFNAICPSAEIPRGLEGGQRVADRNLLPVDPPHDTVERGSA